MNEEWMWGIGWRLTHRVVAQAGIATEGHRGELFRTKAAALDWIKGLNETYAGIIHHFLLKLNQQPALETVSRETWPLTNPFSTHDQEDD